MKKKNSKVIYRKNLALILVILSSVTISVFSIARAEDVSTDDGSETQLPDVAAISGPEMLEWVRQQTNTSRDILEKVQSMLEDARSEKDTIKMTCLDDKVTQIHVSFRGIEERTDSLKLSIDSGDMVSSRQIFSILKIYITRIFGLDSEAENCLGESDVVLGKTESTVNISGDVTAEDPSTGDISDDFGIDQPAQISAYL